MRARLQHINLGGKGHQHLVHNIAGRVVQCFVSYDKIYNFIKGNDKTGYQGALGFYNCTKFPINSFLKSMIPGHYSADLEQ